MGYENRVSRWPSSFTLSPQEKARLEKLASWDNNNMSRVVAELINREFKIKHRARQKAKEARAR